MKRVMALIAMVVLVALVSTGCPRIKPTTRTVEPSVAEQVTK